MGTTAADTAREVELTRKQLEEKVAKLAERAPQEARKLLKRAIFAVLTGVALLLARKAVEYLWERFTGESAPTKAEHDAG